MTKYDLLLKDAHAVMPDGVETTDIGVKDGIIAAIGELNEKAAEKVWHPNRTVRVSGRRRLPCSFQ
ncbi:hypothetical protein S101395_04152 [Bacillus sonorensis]|uniref:Allantoinase n=2 Tax=Bacillus sonorensis TaxID=119858 RepID=M5P0W5_9BACI|nr:hypothetical protein S101395_04152 [Bacillus sonorensis]EME73053.1 hypothetical protein BSONL12_15004 [Bacillus sonorensis L12]NWN78221.1 hypothetical protein [Bacillus sp. (in: firmicutes)]TWK79308.1 Allantoinase [Bacillus paralicheniformis]RHJ08207.1 hypothetical protein DW143_15750 [Bacillus sonorensis]